MPKRYAVEDILKIYEAMRSPYCYYEVYEGPADPAGRGRYIGATPIYRQAEDAVKNAGKIGKTYFIKGVKEDGTKIYLL